MSQAKAGDKVKVHYKGSFKDGKVFDSSEGKDPLEFTIGQKMVVQGFENAIVGMASGEKKKISIQPKEAYGEYRKDLVATIDRSEIPNDIKPELGMMLQVSPEPGRPTAVTVTELNEKTLTLDGNHPLAGKELTFELDLLSIS
ncbi:MAG TPA: peptidylprolyl isomerase [Nitrospinota bacterium]|jgi:peptidylprolyl isomerase|nr:peptidylprolyl isomerase [Nitrospinota bacterium]